MDYDAYLSREYDKYCRDTEVEEVNLRTFEEMVDFLLDKSVLTGDEYEIAIGFGKEDIETLENAVFYKYGKRLEEIEGEF